MKWRQGRRSANIEDRRGGGIPRGVRIGGLGGFGLLAVIVIAVLLGVDPTQLLQDVPVSNVPASRGMEDAGPPSGADNELSEMVAVVLADTEDTWNALLPALGRDYEEPTLVLFSDATRSACGLGEAAMGPFYCPADRKVYIDLAFFGELRDRFGAPGDFAQAYVIAHEVGHHVQNLLGISDEVHADAARSTARPRPTRSRCGSSSRPTASPGSGAHHAQPGAQPARARRPRGGARRRDRHRRRPHPAPGPRHRGARRLHPRHLRAACALVPPGFLHRRPRPVRHLLGRRAVGTETTGRASHPFPTVILSERASAGEPQDPLRETQCSQELRIELQPECRRRGDDSRAGKAQRDGQPRPPERRLARFGHATRARLGAGSRTRAPPPETRTLTRLTSHVMAPTCRRLGCGHRPR